MLVGNRIKLPARGDYCTILGLTESFIYVGLPEWLNGAVCKTVVRGFKSHTRLKQYRVIVSQYDTLGD